MINISDHVPVFLDVEWHSPKTTNIFDPITYQIPTPLWARATQAQIEQYQSRLDFFMYTILLYHIPHFSCSVSSYQTIIDACVIAYLPQMMPSIPYRNLSMPPDKHKQLPGWTPEHNLVREQSLYWHFIWNACERPREGEVANMMDHTRNHYNYLINKIKKNGDLVVRRSLNNALLHDTSRDHWT